MAISSSSATRDRLASEQRALVAVLVETGTRLPLRLTSCFDDERVGHRNKPQRQESLPASSLEQLEPLKRQGKREKF